MSGEHRNVSGISRPVRVRKEIIVAFPTHRATTMKMTYLEKIRDWFEKEKPTSGVSYARIEHDDNCDFWVNKNCSCEPNVKIETINDEKKES